MWNWYKRYLVIQYDLFFQLTTESQNAGPHIVSLGKNYRGGFSVKIFSEERQGIQAQLQAYTPKEAVQTVAAVPAKVWNF